jgi:hypothetical protein
MCATTSPRDCGIAGIRDFLTNVRHCKIFAGSSENVLVIATGDTEGESPGRCFQRTPLTWTEIVGKPSSSAALSVSAVLPDS